MQRHIDDLGRVVIPKEMRKQLKIENGDKINIELKDNKIIITNPKEIDYKEIMDKVFEIIDSWDWDTKPVYQIVNEIYEVREMIRENR